MSFFDDAQIDALVGAERVSATLLFKLDFLSSTEYLCEASHDVTDGSGQKWRALAGGLISIDDISYPSSIAANKRTYSLSAMDPRFAFSVIGDEAEYRSRKLTQYIQFFSDGSPVGVPVVQDVGIMDAVTVSVAPDGSAVLRLTCESRFAIKNSSNLSQYTHSDQQARYPGDLGLERVKLLSLGEVVRWPDY